MKLFRNLYAYRSFMLASVRREFQVKYQSSLLGALWAVLHPLSMIIVYTLIFSQIMRAKLQGVDGQFAYSIFLCTGIITWTLFAEIVQRGQNTFLEHGNLLKKMNFPRLCLPIIVVANALVNYIIIWTLFVLFLVLTGSFPGWVFLSALPIVGIVILFAIGLGITLGVLNVFFRDVGHIFTITISFWFWFTPIVYPMSILPEYIQGLIVYNPMTLVMIHLQNIMVFHTAPNWQDLLPTLVLGVVFCLLGLRLFRKHVGEMVDEL